MVRSKPDIKESLKRIFRISIVPINEMVQNPKKRSQEGVLPVFKDSFFSNKYHQRVRCPLPPPSPDFAVVVGLFVDVDAES